MKNQATPGSTILFSACFLFAGILSITQDRWIVGIPFLMVGILALVQGLNLRRKAQKDDGTSS